MHLDGSLRTFLFVVLPDGSVLCALLLIGKREYFRDPKNVRATYEELKGELEGGIDYLLRKREDDPYRRFFPRIFYEMSSGQAPSFKPE